MESRRMFTRGRAEDSCHTEVLKNCLPSLELDQCCVRWPTKMLVREMMPVDVMELLHRFCCWAANWCRTTEPSFARDIGSIEIGLIDWLKMLLPSGEYQDSPSAEQGWDRGHKICQGKPWTFCESPLLMLRWGGEVVLYPIVTCVFRCRDVFERWVYSWNLVDEISAKGTSRSVIDE